MVDILRELWLALVWSVTRTERLEELMEVEGIDEVVEEKWTE